MKGLALEVVWGIIIAMVGVLIFLLLITGTFKNAANWFYCDIYMKIINFFSGSGLASIPEQCKGVVKGESKREDVKDVDNKIFSRKLLAYIIACWNELEVKGLYESHPCYELRLSGNVENVSEENVSSILVNEDHCRSIENSDFNAVLDYDCGEKNQIIWSVDGSVTSLTENNVTDTLNEFTEPEKIPIEESMIPAVGNIKTISQLKTFISNAVPDSVCKSIGDKCKSWKYIKTNGYVVFRISSDDSERIYAYYIDSVMRDFENKGITQSVINNQKIILIQYNGEKDAVEVMG